MLDTSKLKTGLVVVICFVQMLYVSAVNDKIQRGPATQVTRNCSLAPDFAEHRCDALMTEYGEPLTYRRVYEIQAVAADGTRSLTGTTLTEYEGIDVNHPERVLAGIQPTNPFSNNTISLLLIELAGYGLWILLRRLLNKLEPD